MDTDYFVYKKSEPRRTSCRDEECLEINVEKKINLNYVGGMITYII